MPHATTTICSAVHCYHVHADGITIAHDRIPMKGLSDCAIYEFDISKTNGTFMNSVVTKVKLQLYYTSLGKVEFLEIDDFQSVLATDILMNSNKVYANKDFLANNEKNISTVLLNHSPTDYICNVITASSDSFLLLIRCIDDKDTGYIGGQSTPYGTFSSWEKNSLDIESPPRLIIETKTETGSKNHITHLMKYTSSEINAVQKMPSKSLGGYASHNTIYPGINDNSAMEQNLISIDGKYHTDHIGIDKIFGPSKNLEQYRCVAIVQKSLPNYVADDVEINLIQEKSGIQLDIGIEVPLFDSRFCNIKDAVSLGDTEIFSDSISILDYSIGHFNGGHISIPDAGFDSIISSYDFNKITGNAEFILEDEMPNIAAGTSFTINPAPSQIIIDETISPSENSNYFFGFIKQKGSNKVSFEQIRENQGRMHNGDTVYMWIKKTMPKNTKMMDKTNAAIIFKFKERHIVQ